MSDFAERAQDVLIPIVGLCYGAGAAIGTLTSMGLTFGSALLAASQVYAGIALACRSWRGRTFVAASISQGDA